MAEFNYRTINIDKLDPESSANFPMETLLPATLPPPSNSSAAANTATQVRQMLRSGDAETALAYVLDTAPLGGDERAKEVHMAAVIEVLQGIRQGEMSRVLEGVCGAGANGSERADCLMKYLYVFDHSISLRKRLLTRAGIKEWRRPARAMGRSRPRRPCRRRVRDSRRYRPGILGRAAAGSR